MVARRSRRTVGGCAAAFLDAAFLCGARSGSGDLRFFAAADALGAARGFEGAAEAAGLRAGNCGVLAADPVPVR